MPCSSMQLPKRASGTIFGDPTTVASCPRPDASGTLPALMASNFMWQSRFGFVAPIGPSSVCWPRSDIFGDSSIGGQRALPARRCRVQCPPGAGSGSETGLSLSQPSRISCSRAKIDVGSIGRSGTFGSVAHDQA